MVSFLQFLLFKYRMTIFELFSRVVYYSVIEYSHNFHHSQILLDGPGILKYADFGLAKVEGENLEELFQKFSDAGETWATESQLDDRMSRTAG